MCMSFQHLSKTSSKIMLQQGISITHSSALNSHSWASKHLSTPNIHSAQPIDPNWIYLLENIFLILATAVEQDYLTSSVCPNIRQTSSFQSKVWDERMALSKSGCQATSASSQNPEWRDAVSGFAVGIVPTPGVGSGRSLPALCSADCCSLLPWAVQQWLLDTKTDVGTTQTLALSVWPGRRTL